MANWRALIVTIECPGHYVGFEPRMLSFARTRNAAIARSLALRDAEWYTSEHNKNWHKGAPRAKMVFWEATRISLDKALGQD